MKKRILTLLLCLVMLFSCVGAGIDAITDDSETVPFADETPVAPVGDTNAADAEATPAPEATPIAAAPVENNAELPLFDRLMACTTAEQFKAVAEAAGEDAVNALSESELAALEKHYGEIYVPVMPETVVFTDAGPFMPAVSVASRARMMLKAAPASERATDNGLVTSKTATKLPDGNYKITIEAYATGEVKTETSDENQSFVFRIVCADKGVDMQVTVIGNGSVTVKGLPVGTYKITEDTAWAWRYNLQGVASDGTGTIAGITDGCTYTPNGTNNSIVFTNSRIQYNWLSFVNYVKNVFGMKDA